MFSSSICTGHGTMLWGAGSHYLLSPSFKPFIPNSQNMNFTPCLPRHVKNYRPIVFGGGTGGIQWSKGENVISNRCDIADFLSGTVLDGYLFACLGLFLGWELWRLLVAILFIPKMQAYLRVRPYLYSLLYPQNIAQCLPHRRGSVNICWTIQWVYLFH